MPSGPGSQRHVGQKAELHLAGDGEARRRGADPGGAGVAHHAADAQRVVHRHALGDGDDQLDAGGDARPRPRPARRSAAPSRARPSRRSPRPPRGSRRTPARLRRCPRRRAPRRRPTMLVPYSFMRRTWTLPVRPVAPCTITGVWRDSWPIMPRAPCRIASTRLSAASRSSSTAMSGRFVREDRARLGEPVADDARHHRHLERRRALQRDAEQVGELRQGR